jgi:hypothetical protein
MVMITEDDLTNLIHPTRPWMMMDDVDGDDGVDGDDDDHHG